MTLKSAMTFTRSDPAPSLTMITKTLGCYSDHNSS
jgi:hypothetical protein